VQPHVSGGAAADGLVQQLAAETHQRLDAEFMDQPVAFQLKGARVWPAASGRLRVHGEGIADFGAEGSATTTVEALYDPATGKWLRLDYQLL
jgi:hypothetical protein